MTERVRGRGQEKTCNNTVTIMLYLRGISWKGCFDSFRGRALRALYLFAQVRAMFEEDNLIRDPTPARRELYLHRKCKDR